jgi:nicotinamide-nucleotide amidase
MSEQSNDCIDAVLIECARDVVETLRDRGLTVITAESCTAGLISAALSLAEGASDVLHGGFVTYTKANKTMALGVDAEILAREGSVNARVVQSLCEGALARSPADLALAISGVLGPSPDEDGNPVGLIYFCCLQRGGEPSHRRKDYGAQPHNVLRRTAVLDAFDMILACARER